VAQLSRYVEQRLFKSGPVVLFRWLARPGWPVAYVSPNVCEQFGYTPETFTRGDTKYVDIIHPDDWPRLAEQIEYCSQGGDETVNREYRLADSDGVWRWVHDVTLIIRDRGGVIVHYHGYVVDVTARCLAEAELAAERRTARLILQSIIDGVFGIDCAGQFTFLNPAAVELLGYAAQEELLGEESHYLTGHAKPDGSAYASGECLILGVLDDGGARHSVGECFRRRDGTVFPVEYRCAPICEQGELVGAVVTFRDISEQERIEEQIRHQANHDALTGLPNRNLLEDRTERALAHARRRGLYGAVLFIDLDGFKDINDSLGHAVGDALLQTVAQRKAELLREEDTVARLGGDEFVVLLSDLGEEPETAADTARTVAEKLRRATSEPFHIDGYELRITVSIGIALFPLNGETAREVLKAADIAMYQAKACGRDGHRFFLPSMQQAVYERLVVENDLRRALESDELTLHFQPQLNVESNRIVGAEALLRWRHPEQGMVMPCQFIPLAEETNLILKLGDWVLRSACEAISRWQEGMGEFTPMRISVNVSPRQFRQQDFVDRVERTLAETGARAEQLELEITEDVLLDSAEYSVEKMRALRKLGVRLAIDDFGTGYSSLAYLKRMPLDTLKIDREFIRDVHDPDDAAIIDTILAIAWRFGLSVVAEGVETDNQLQFLRVRTCDAYQGFLFSQAVPADEFERVYRQAASTA
jgi:diguanylate cyclase (GGDEF)-like protein/PAS domain S-box-containing protein